MSLTAPKQTQMQMSPEPCLLGSLHVDETPTVSPPSPQNSPMNESASFRLDLSECDPSFDAENTEEASELSGQSSNDGVAIASKEEQPEEDDAAAYFQELAEQRNSRRRGILIVRCPHDSRNESVYKRLLEDYRKRRDERIPVNASSNIRVQFDSVTIHEFPMILGDNPGCYSGPPLTISWKPQETVTLPVKKYEATHPPPRRHGQMILPASMREDILRRAGYGRNEIIELTKPVNIARRWRQQTKGTQHLDKVNELVERLRRGTRHVVTLGYIKRQERKFLEPYVQMPHMSSSSKKGDLSNSISSTVALEISEEITGTSQ